MMSSSIILSLTEQGLGSVGVWCEEVEVEVETLKRTHKNIILLFLYAHWVYIWYHILPVIITAAIVASYPGREWPGYEATAIVTIAKK